ncbi:hypothetical protein T7987_15905 [Sulfitobacter faviae]|uniref:Uncharacterized protein n=1 Tax=Sulfitobacter faviae TaxID=1775881 RepID=A0ABZ0V166_9RHOB|nr:hypothetical protein [Sulfitobacter faviae]WPZ21627.1 hypothetical protein T7987_15905 [Sulfitobacter faviae]
MPSPRSPSMPTQTQIKQAFDIARQLCPGARIKGIGPDGVIFDYPDKSAASDEWEGKPFSGDAL